MLTTTLLVTKSVHFLSICQKLCVIK